MPKKAGRVSVGLILGLTLALTLSTTGASAQYFFPGGGGFGPVPAPAPASAPAPAPVLPDCGTGVLPPNTSPSADAALVPALTGIPTKVSFWAYLGDSGCVYELLAPPLITASVDVDIWSGPNAVQKETDAAIDFGTKPAGTDFIYFFERGTRAYAFDIAYGNYGWVDLG